MPLTKIDDFIPFQNLNHTFPAFPIMWVDERATIDKPNADKWDSQVRICLFVGIFSTISNAFH